MEESQKVLQEVEKVRSRKKDAEVRPAFLNLLSNVNIIVFF